MVRTPAQKRAVRRAKEALRKAEKKLGKKEVAAIKKRISGGGRVSPTPQKTVPHDFVGPLRPGTLREPAPKVKAIPKKKVRVTARRPVRRAIPVAIRRATQKKTQMPAPKKTVPHDFVGPLRPGVTRRPAPKAKKKIKRITRKTIRREEIARPKEFGIRKFKQLNKDREMRGKSSFTAAVPVGRKDGKLIIQDFTFTFEGDKLVSSNKLKGSVSIDEKEFEKRSGVKATVVKVVAPIKKQVGKKDVAKFPKIKDITKIARGKLPAKAKEPTAAEKRRVTKKAKKFLFPFDQPKTGKELKKFLKSNKRLIGRQEKFLDDINKKIEKNKKAKPGIGKSLNTIALRFNKNAIEERLGKLKKGVSSAGLLIQEFPIPAAPSAVIPKQVTNVAFVGKQKVKGGKVITDIVFRTKSGTIGVAKGVTVSKGKAGTSIVAGKFGRLKAGKPPTLKNVKDIKSFIGAEKAKIVKPRVQLRKTVELLRSKKSIGKVDVINKNIKALQQRGIGKIATVKGNKFLKAGKKVKGIKLDDFSSISAIFNKKELSTIIGKSITAKGAKANFIGIIKGSKSGLGSIKLDPKSSQQFSKAFQKVVQATAAAVAKAEQQGLTQRLTKIAQAATILATKPKKPIRITPKKPTPKQKQVQKPKPKVTPKPTPKPKPVTKQIPKVKKVSKRKVSGKRKSVSRQTPKAKPKIKQAPKTKQVPKQKAKQKAKQRQRLRRKLQAEAKQRARRTVSRKIM
ncbi:MAG: hypothetical protein KAS87_06365, partial [Candidatus Omnitrophica bacterium]|nr:hypothetical protein [Candidatus Omnitrophota bacterium]